jgi:transketolase
MRSSSGGRALVRARAWLVIGPLGRGLAFAVDFALALRTMLANRRG